MCECVRVRGVYVRVYAYAVYVCGRARVCACVGEPKKSCKLRERERDKLSQAEIRWIVSKREAKKRIKKGKKKQAHTQLYLESL